MAYNIDQMNARNLLQADMKSLGLGGIDFPEDKSKRLIELVKLLRYAEFAQNKQLTSYSISNLEVEECKKNLSEFIKELPPALQATLAQKRVSKL